MPRPMKNLSKQKEKFDSKAFKKVIAYCKPYMPAIIISILFAIIGAITTIIGPDKIGELMNEITSGIFTGINMDNFIKIVIYLICLYAIGAVFNYLQQFIMANVTQKTAKNLRTDINKKVNKLPLAYFDRTTKGDILSRVSNDVDTISQTLGSSIANLISSVVLFVGVIFMMFKTNWVLALVTIGSSLLGFAFMFIIIANSQKYFNKRQEQLGEMNGHIEEIYTNHETVKSYSAYPFEKRKFLDVNNRLYSSTWKGQFLAGLMMPIMNFVGNLSYVLIFVVGVSIIISGGTAVTLGTLMSFIIYSKLFAQPLGTFAQSMSSIQQASAAGKRVFDMLEEKEIKDETKKSKILNEQDTKGNVEFRNVRFAYEEDKVIINNFSAKIQSGQKVAIVGPTGAGKTTMVNLLMRFYELKEPRLIINNKITDYKIFDNGKSIRLLLGEDNTLVVNNEKTNIAVDDIQLPKNQIIKFSQDFDAQVDEKNMDYKLKILTGNQLENIENTNLGIAYYGDIFIDQIPVKSLTRNNIHELFDMILQDTWLFGGTIRENLVYNTPNVTDKQLDSVCEAVGLTHFIKTLPNGYDTILGDDSALSEGQKQQLTIARAMIKDSPLLILDEATSNVDTRTEVVIQNAMDQLTSGKTSFVIAHRLSTIRNADIILVMKNGDIVESGNHEQLLNNNGFYAELYNSQFKVINE